MFYILINSETQNNQNSSTIESIVDNGGLVQDRNSYTVSSYRSESKSDQSPCDLEENGSDLEENRSELDENGSYLDESGSDLESSVSISETSSDERSSIEL